MICHNGFGILTIGGPKNLLDEFHTICKTDSFFCNTQRTGRAGFHDKRYEGRFQLIRVCLLKYTEHLLALAGALHKLVVVKTLILAELAHRPAPAILILILQRHRIIDDCVFLIHFAFIFS